jgi:uncharacterized protein (DUF58 family)
MFAPAMARQIRRLQLRARRAVEDLLGGEYHSIFKGAGLSFEEVREYQSGDDVRSIDWNVTARMGVPFIKRYVEERELTVLLLVDVSGSQAFGTGPQSKRAIAAELAALLSFSAIYNNDRVGLLTFSDQVEQYLPPRKGTRHALRLIRDILYFEPKHRGTSIRTALEYLLKVQRRRAIVFLFSDFADVGFERALRVAGKKHDLIVVRIEDPRESVLPAVGFLPIQDGESGRQRLIDTNHPQVQAAWARMAARRREEFLRLARTAGSDTIDVSTDGSHLDALVRFFRRRERRLRRR